MGKTILTFTQSHFLELAQSDKSIIANFYLTGGTALSAFYYFHRESQDLDLFCERREVDPVAVDAFLKKIKRKFGIKEIKKSQFLGLVSRLLVLKNREILKVDFNYYPFLRIDRGVKFKNLEVDSVYDIATNKVHTIFMRPRIRDYVDLYFILTQEDYSLDRLIIDAKAKFDWHIDRVNLASQFSRVTDFLRTKELPKMLVPFNPKEMEKFFLKLAKGMKKEIFK